jgi:hypothetical protein
MIRSAQLHDPLALAAGVYTEPGIVVDKSLTLQREDAATIIVQAAATRGTAADRVFTIPFGVTVTLQVLTIQYGRAVNDAGGGLVNEGTLTLTQSTISGNTATWGARTNRVHAELHMNMIVPATLIVPLLLPR